MMVKVFNAAATTFALTVDSYFIGSKFSAKDLNDIWTLLSDVALEAGNDTNTFSVDDPISDEHAVNKIYAETNFANINGAIDQDFTALTIQDSGGDQVVGSRQGSITPVSGTAGAAYTATEQVIINDLVTTVNDLINKLSSATGHGLIT